MSVMYRLTSTAGEIFPHPTPPPPRAEGAKKLELAPSPYPLPAAERVNPLKLIINSLPLDGEGAGWG